MRRGVRLAAARWLLLCAVALGVVAMHRWVTEPANHPSMNHSAQATAAGPAMALS